MTDAARAPREPSPVGVALFVATLLLAGFVAVAFLLPPTFRAQAELMVESAATAAPALGPVEAARKLREETLDRALLGRILDESAPGAAPEDRALAAVGADRRISITSLDGKTFAVVVEQEKRERALAWANRVAEKAVERAPTALAPDTSREREALAAAYEARAGELRVFVAANPDAAEPATKVEPERNQLSRDEAVARLRSEREAIKVKIGNAEGDPMSPAQDTAQLRRRLAEIENLLRAEQRPPERSKEVPAAVRTEYQRLVEAANAARDRASNVASVQRVRAKLVRRASAPSWPVDPNRKLLLGVGLLVAAFAAFYVAFFNGAAVQANGTAVGGATPVHPAGRALPATTQPIIDPRLARAARQLPPAGGSSEPPPGRRPASDPPPAQGTRPSSAPPPGISSAPPPPRISSAPPPRISSAPPARISSAPPVYPPQSPPPPGQSDPPQGDACLVMAHRVPDNWQPDPNLDPLARKSLCDVWISQIGSRGLVVAVSGPASVGAHKSRVAAELALALAEAEGMRALLLDADFHDSSLRRLMRLEMPPFVGYSEQLGSRVREMEPHWYVLRCAESLHVLLEGTTHAPDIILSQHFEQSVLEFRDYYDVIVLHGPSTARAVECRAVSDVVDRVLLVTTGATPAEVESGAAFFPSRPLDIVDDQQNIQKIG